MVTDGWSCAGPWSSPEVSTCCVVSVSLSPISRCRRSTTTVTEWSVSLSLSLPQTHTQTANQPVIIIHFDALLGFPGQLESVQENPGCLLRDGDEAGRDEDVWGLHV